MVPIKARGRSPQKILLISLMAIFLSACASGVAGERRAPDKAAGIKNAVVLSKTDERIDKPVVNNTAAGEKVKLKDALLRLSVEHPGVQARARRLSAAIEGAGYLGRTYPDPRLGVFWLNGPYKKDLRFVKDKTPMTGVEFRLMQAIPFPGRLSLRADIADTDVVVRRLELALVKNKIAAEFLGVLTDLNSLKERLNLLRGYLARIKVVREAARTRYSVGRGNLADVSRAELALQKYRQLLLQLEGQYHSAGKRLNYYLSDETNDNIPLDLAELKDYIAGLDIQTDSFEQDDILKNSSLNIALAKTRIVITEKESDLAKMNYLPDFEVFAAYRKRAYIESDPARGEKFMSFGLTVRVPLWSALANPPRVREKSELQSSARMSSRDVLLRETSIWRVALTRKSALKERLELYQKKLIPTARSSLSSARLAYQTGKVDFDVFLSGWNALFALESEVIELEAERNKQMILIATILNKILPEFTEGEK